MSDDLLFEVSEHVASITLNRPDQKNALTRNMSLDLVARLTEADRSPDVRAILIQGSDGNFCAGADLKERAAQGGERKQDKSAATVFAGDETSWWTLDIQKPMICAIDGYAFAAGMDLALLGDIRIASTRARFGLTHITHGFFSGGGAVQRLMRAIPQSMAMEMILTGDRIDAEAALQCGLISRVVGAAELKDEATKIARKIANHAPLAVKAAKEVALSALDMSLKQSLRFATPLRWAIGQTEDAKEGPRAFAEKRKPEFKGS